MPNGWIKLHRKMLDWEWFKDANTSRVFIYLLLKANTEDKNWQGVLIKRGQLITSQQNIASFLSGKYSTLTIRQTRVALDKLKLTGELTVQTNNHYSLVTINNYATYQQDGRQNAHQMRTTRQRSVKQMSTTKEDKEDKKKEDTTYLEIINFFNETFGKQTKSYATWQDNCDFHLKSYSVADIKQAITNWKRYGWWAKEPSLELLFRTKNKSGPCDYIDQLLNLQDAVKGSKDPLAGLVKKGAYVSG